ncbi:methylthioribulose 1-phosphate dehydratase [Pseudomonas sp. F1_0610]|uniref:methylthioribulose 1-phosphate dehydratase n=1 Tax=Pseudomonas sp. F1_0610 TaxID=3114284 RepID=UPI0039C204F3
MMRMREQLSTQIIEAGKFLYSRGWSPATSSNYSARLDQQHILLTASGKHKGQLTAADILLCNAQGDSLEQAKQPSAETLLHAQLYQLRPKVGAVLHTHSINATVISLASKTTQLRLTGYELQKAFSGINTHECELIIPIFDNTQNMLSLCAQIAPYLAAHPDCWAYIIRGHGVYTWGADMNESLRHIEALEFLLECELKLLSLGAH